MIYYSSLNGSPHAAGYTAGLLNYGKEMCPSKRACPAKDRWMEGFAAGERARKAKLAYRRNNHRC
jgi:ribosome modulation factor